MTLLEMLWSMFIELGRHIWAIVRRGTDSGAVRVVEIFPGKVGSVHRRIILDTLERMCDARVHIVPFSDRDENTPAIWINDDENGVYGFGTIARCLLALHNPPTQSKFAESMRLDASIESLTAFLRPVDSIRNVEEDLRADEVEAGEEQASGSNGTGLDSDAVAAVRSEVLACLRKLERDLVFIPRSHTLVDCYWACALSWLLASGLLHPWALENFPNAMALYETWGS